MLRGVLQLITVLALHCLVCAESDIMLATTKLDMDLNFTIADVCHYLSRRLLCILGDQVYTHAGTCLTQQYNNAVVFGLCPYFLNEYSWLRYSEYYSLPFNITLMEHSNLTCGPYNREGLLCSKCKPGYGPAVYSFSLMCAECSDNGVGWALYLLLVLFPITVFYIIVIIFNIRATAPPFTAFVMMCQIFSTIDRVSVPLKMILRKIESLSVLINVVRALCGIWNLDFFRHLVPPFCVSRHLGNMQALSLEYLHILYPFSLILVTLICIELHARNFKLIVLLWKPFHMIVTRLRRSLDPRASIINAFSTFLLLALSKSIVITNYSFAVTSVYIYFGVPVINYDLYNPTFLYADPTIHFCSKQHLPYLIGSILLLVLFFAFPTLLLCLYPTRIFQKLLSHCLSLRWQHAVSAFIDTFQGHYKDGTNGTRDYRAASSIHLLVIFVVIIVSFGHEMKTHFLEYIHPGFTILSLFYALVRPCKQEYANVIQSLLYALIAFVVYVVSSAKFHKHTFHRFLMMLLCLLTPHAVLCIYTIYKIIRRSGLNLLFLRRVLCNCGSVKSSKVYQVHQSCPNEHSQLLITTEEPHY